MARTPKTWTAEIEFAQFHTAATIVHALGSIVAEMRADGIEEPLIQPVTLAAVMTDICRIVGTEVPSDVADVIG